MREIVAFRSGQRFDVDGSWRDRVTWRGLWGFKGWHRLCRKRPLTERLKEQDGARNCGVEARDLTGHRDTDEEVNSPADSW